MQTERPGEGAAWESSKRRFPTWAKVLIALGVASLFLCVGLGLLVTFLMPSVVRKLYVANTTKAKADIVQLSHVVDQFAIDHSGRYPESLHDLLVPDSAGTIYLDRENLPRDPWGREYGYELSGSKYRVFTLGADGLSGGSGEDQDMDNLLVKAGDA